MPSNVTVKKEEVSPGFFKYTVQVKGKLKGLAMSKKPEIPLDDYPKPKL